MSTGEPPAADDRRPCPVCDEPVESRATNVSGGLRRGSCRRCGLQLVRDPGAGWREIRG